MSTTALDQGPGLADAYLAGFGAVHVSHAPRGARRSWEVAFGHQFVKSLGISTFHSLELLDGVLDIVLDVSGYCWDDIWKIFSRFYIGL